MATAELQAPGQVDLDGFETVHDGAASQWRPSSVGDFITGEYLGSERILLKELDVDGSQKTFTIYTLKALDGVVWSVANSYMIDKCFAEVTVGNMVRLTYLGDIDLGAGRNSMHNFSIAVRR